MVENPDVSSGGFPRDKTRMECTPKASEYSNTTCVSGLVPNSKDIFFLLSVSFHISYQLLPTTRKSLQSVWCSNSGTERHTLPEQMCHNNNNNCKISSDSVCSFLTSRRHEILHLKNTSALSVVM